jgi:hypothetical protein
LFFTLNVWRTRNKARLDEDHLPHVSAQTLKKNLNTLSCWSTLRRNKPSGRQLFGVRLSKNQGFRATACG